MRCGTAALAATPGAFQPSFAGGSSDAYAVKVSPEGQLVGATYLGGSGEDGATLIAVAPNGSVAISGTTQSTDFPGISGIASSTAPASFVTSIFISLTVLNAASYVPNTIAPGEIVSLLGYGLGPDAGVAATSGATLPTELAGVQVSFGGLPAPPLYAQAHVINAQVPWELAGETSTTVAVSYPGVASMGTPVIVGQSLPGLFGVGNSDGTQDSPSNPAKPGDFITIYGTGGGPTSPAGVTGAFWPQTASLPLLVLPVTVMVAGENAKVLYAGASPLSSSGIFQINALLPSDLQASPASSLVLIIDGTSSAAAPVAIQ